MLLRRKLVPIAMLVMAIAVTVAALAVMLASFVFVIGQVRQWRADRGGERGRAELRGPGRAFGNGGPQAPGRRGGQPFGAPGGSPGRPGGPGGQMPGGQPGGQPGGPALGVSVELADGGLVVRSVVPNSAAAVAGVREGDLIVKAAGTDARDIDGLRASIGAVKPGETYDVVVRRGGQEQTLQARKADAPTGPPASPRGGAPALPSLPRIRPSA